MRYTLIRAIATLALAFLILGLAGCPKPEPLDQPDLGTMPMLAPTTPEEVPQE